MSTQGCEKAARAKVGRFQGEVRHQRRLGTVLLTEVEHAGGTESPEHEHAVLNLCFVLCGGFTEVLGALRGEVGPGWVTVTPAASPHAERFAAGSTRTFGIEYRGGSLPRSFSQLPATVGFADASVFGPALQLFRGLRGDTSHRMPDLRVALNRITAAVSRELVGRSVSESAGWVAEVRCFVQSEFLNGISLATVSDIVRKHPTHVSRRYRQVYGYTLTDELRRLRATHAAHQLLVGTSSLSSVAYGAGYADQSHFCRDFKRVTGLTPTEFTAALG